MAQKSSPELEAQFSSFVHSQEDCVLPKKTTASFKIMKRIYGSDMFRRARNLTIFVVLELLWLGLGIFAEFGHTHSIEIREIDFMGFSFDSDVLPKSALSNIASVYHMFAFCFAGGIISEAFASEWWYLLGTRRIEHNTNVDRVSLLTSGFFTKLRHAIHGERVTKVFRLAFVTSLLLVPLHSQMMGAVIIGLVSDAIRSKIQIGALPSISTTSPSTADLLQLAARDAYSVEIDNESPNFYIDESDTPILFGLPSKNMLDEYAYINYRSDAVSFNYTCQWVAPTFLGFDEDSDVEQPDIMSSRWSLDDSGVECTVDPASIDVGNSLGFASSLYGFWPLVNADNLEPFSGSLAWLLFGGNSTNPLSVVNMTSIPETLFTFNASGWSDLIQAADGTDPNNVQSSFLTTHASVLLCDPRTEFQNVFVNFVLGEFDYWDSTREEGGQLDHTGAEWMFGLGLDGIPFDTVLTRLPLFNNTSEQEEENASVIPLTDMSRLVFELAFQAPEKVGLGATLQDLGNISTSLNKYMSNVGASVFLDGSLENMTVSAKATPYAIKEQLVISWPSWLASAVLLFVVATLLTVLVASEVKRSEVLSIGRVMEEVERRNDSEEK